MEKRVYPRIEKQFSVVVENVIDLFGVNFDVVFDSSKVRYVEDSATNGDGKIILANQKKSM